MTACMSCKRATVSAPQPSIETADPWKAAVAKVEQDRGEIVGKHATVQVPDELKHYVDRRRFLAVQTADSQEHVEDISSDFVQLARLIGRGEFVEMKPLGTDYILYGVGDAVTDAPFAHYDRSSRQEIPLVPTEEAFKEEVQGASEEVKKSAANVASLEV